MKIFQYSSALFVLISVCLFPYSAHTNPQTNRTAPPHYALQMRAHHGTVTSQPAGIPCASDCFYKYPDKTSVTLSITREKTITATFSRNMHNLSVILPTGNAGPGSVGTSSDDIVCGPDCSEAYEHGTTVTLKATADTGSTFHE